MATMAQAPTARATRVAERRFYAAMSVAILAIVVVGFARSFFLRSLFPGWPSPHEPIFYVHGSVFAAWFVLLVAQSSLIAAGRNSLHRTLGMLGACLAVAMVVLGVRAALVAAARPTGFVGIPVPPLQFLAIPLADMVVFPVFVALAIAKRQRPQAHKRLMLLASIAMLPAAVARMPGVIGGSPLSFFGLTDALLIPLALWDYRSRGQLHEVTLWGGLALVLSQPLRLALSGTPLWMDFARWATGVHG
jgi:hypothetical protein